MRIEKHTIGTGDRFAHQGRAQLRAVQQANADARLAVHPVWNKSHREHVLIGSRPDDLRAEADDAVRALGWTGAYYVDADHIGLGTVDAFLDASDFYTLDMADFVGVAADAASIGAFADDMARHGSALTIPGLHAPLDLHTDTVRAAAVKFLRAVQEAGRIYRHIEGKQGKENFVTEVSIDETDTAQTPAELLLILAMIAREGIPAQTVAPKFTGRFNKGVDYVGDLAQFEREFDADLAVVAFAKREFGLPDTLKLSVHSGSDKFSLYQIINRQLKAHDAGVHVKTAGTTWLEELVGLAEAGGDGLAIARGVYAEAHGRYDELTKPYTAVIDVDRARLPAPAEVSGWEPEQYVRALRHDEDCPEYNPSLRQLLHVAFKVAARMGARYTDALRAHEPIIARNVTDNLLRRHLLPIFG